MIVVMKSDATREEIDAVSAEIRAQGLEAFMSEGQERVIIGVVGIDIDRVAHIGTFPGVEQAFRVTSPHKLASLEHQRDRTRIVIGGKTPIGAGSPLVVMAGPCSVESLEQLMDTARLVHRDGAQILRGGAYKPRTSPYAFQGLGETGIDLMTKARAETGMPIVSEMTDASQMEFFEEHVDLIQIGSRNMHNFTLLRAARSGPNARAPEARLRRDDRRVADGRRVHPQRRQQQRDPVRARHPHLRTRNAQHARPFCRARLA